MKKLLWIGVITVLTLVGVLALNFGNVRRDARALLVGTDAVAYSEPRLRVVNPPGPPQPKVSPAEAGIDAESIAVAVDYAARRNTRALVIGHGGHIVFEKYWDDLSLETPVDLSGFSPVLSALLLGKAMNDDRRIQLDDPLANYIPAWQEDVRGAVTLGELLAGDGGFARATGWPWPGSRAAAYAVRGDLRQVLRDWPRDDALKPGESPPDVSADLLALVLETHLKTPYETQLVSGLWAPLGAGDFDLGHDAHGRVRAGCCLRARLGDWMRVGELLAHDGRFEGNEFTPPGFMKKMLSATRPGSPVGYFTRVDGQFAAKDVARLESAGKQRLWVIPSLRLVILRLGDEPPASEGWDEAMIPDSIIRGTRGWQPASAVEGEKIDLNRYAPH
jgi:CubicO group peptidase (beta-lactamase class C family)